MAMLMVLQRHLSWTFLKRGHTYLITRLENSEDLEGMRLGLQICLVLLCGRGKRIVAVANLLGRRRCLHGAAVNEIET